FSVTPQRVASGAQIECHQASILGDAHVVGRQMSAERWVVIEPPERRPPENHETRAGSTQPLDLLDCRFIAGWRSPVLAVPLHERHSPTARDARPQAPLGLVDQDQRLFPWHQPGYFLYRLPYPLLPMWLLGALAQRLHEGPVARGALVQAGVLVRQVAEPA